MVFEIEFNADVYALGDIVHDYFLVVIGFGCGIKNSFYYFLPDHLEIYLYCCIYIALSSWFYQQIGFCFKNRIFLTNFQTLVKRVVFLHKFR